MKPTLSKSQYIKGLQCPKRLWFYRHRKDLMPETDAATQARFDAGDEIGRLAQAYFPGGAEVTDEYWNIEKAVQATQQFIKDGHEIIYEATAIHPVDGSYSRIDILHKMPGTDEWDLIEVKSSTGVKDYHIDDMAFQYHVFYHAGYKIRRCQMMVIDNQYIRQGDIDPQQLFRLEDISGEVFAKQGEVEHLAAQYGYLLNRKTEPEAEIGARCFAPFECEYRHHCWRHVPDYSIYNIFPKKKADEIHGHISSYDLKDVPPDLYPGGNKAVDLECYQNAKDYIDKDSIAAFLSDLEYPLYYLDYETMMGGLPFYDGTYPYQQIPFQFSLHVQHEPEGNVQHFGFLHKERTDPRLAFTERLIETCGDAGSVIVYNAGFEARINRELARDFPQHAPALKAINGRIFDLMMPFQKRWLYKPEQQGSYSIKYVLPAYVPGLSYDGMTIANGGMAMEQYFQFVNGDIPEEKHDALWQALTEYCKLDTYAMVELLRVLRNSNV